MRGVRLSAPLLRAGVGWCSGSWPGVRPSGVWASFPLRARLPAGTWGPHARGASVLCSAPARDGEWGRSCPGGGEGAGPLDRPCEAAGGWEQDPPGGSGRAGWGGRVGEELSRWRGVGAGRRRVGGRGKGPHGGGKGGWVGEELSAVVRGRVGCRKGGWAGKGPHATGKPGERGRARTRSGRPVGGEGRWVGKARTPRGRAGGRGRGPRATGRAGGWGKSPVPGPARAPPGAPPPQGRRDVTPS